MKSDKQNSLPVCHSYLLRIWTEDTRSKSPRRIVLIDLQSGNHRGFGDFKQMAQFLGEEPHDELDSTSMEMDGEST